ncbi:hypothetical protein C0995_013943 [Termitomyces sp. Mi166|nr:hypothetical protein C0995_013943 [Termitomyces sp. Mi166\
MAKEKWEAGGYNPADGKDLVPIQVYAVQDDQQRKPGGFQQYVFTCVSLITAFHTISDDLILQAKSEM